MTGTPLPSQSQNMRSIVFVLCASVAFSINDLVFKLLSGTYPLHQMLFIRSAVALILCTAIIVPLSGGVTTLRTRRPHFHLLRGFFVVTSNIALYTGLAVLPIADTIAIFFSAPLMITGLSAVLLGEHVGVRRLFAVVLGLFGVLLIVKPGLSGFEPETLLPIAAAFTYALIQIMTRWMGMTERAVTLFFYNQVVFVSFSLIVGLAIGDGRFGNPNDPATDFLFRAWTWPTAWDISLLVMLGALSASGGYLMTVAYRQSPSNIVAPFEYVALLMAVIWGIVFWDVLPDLLAGVGILLIVVSGLIVAMREAHLGFKTRRRRPEV